MEYLVFLIEIVKVWFAVSMLALALWVIVLTGVRTTARLIRKPRTSGVSWPDEKNE